MMIEDKLKATDWEATDVAVAEQVARESYLQWLADQEKARPPGQSQIFELFSISKYSLAGRHPPAATVTSGAVSPRATSSTGSPRGGASPRSNNSPKAGCSYQSEAGRLSPKPGSSRSDHGLGPGFHLRETASFLNGLPPDAFG